MSSSVIKGLSYRLWCSCKRRWLLMLLIFLVPIVFGGVFLLILSENLFTQASEKMGPVITKPLTKSVILEQCTDMNPIAVSPDNENTRKVMAAAAEMFPATVQFGPVFYGQTALEVGEHLLNITRDNDMSLKCGFGIIFDRLSENELAYTLRSIKSDIWYTTLRFPSSMVPGPMNNGDFYLTQGFLPLQVAINEAFSRSMLDVTLEEWEIQAFPYPAYETQDELSTLYTFMSIMNCYGLALLLCRFAVMVIQEKTSGVKELLKINGIRTWMIYTSWFVMFGAISAVISLAITLMWKYPYSFGTTLTNTDGLLFFIILFIYACSALASVGLLASFINNQKYGMLFTFLYWLGSYSVVLRILPTFHRNYFLLFLLTFLPNGGISVIFEAIAEFEAAGSGAVFSNLFDSPPNDTIMFPIGISMLIMLLCTVVCILLMAYVDAIMPGPFGRAKPWYFIFPLQSCSRVDATVLKEHNTNSISLIEEVGDSTEVGIRVSKLTKVFGTLRAVDDLNISIYKNQITALLGHNGAGKSTMFSMISGMFSPTSGSVYAGNYDIFEDGNIDLFRKELGFCPQHDLLIDELSVEQHIIFFCMIKGLSFQEAKAQSDHWSKKFKIYESRHKRVLELSGGMKRKLCLSLALVGSPKYLLLDEPSSGLDPESRRDIWDVLLTMRGNRTIIISTHFMEEADALGDRIAIVGHGKLKCYGTKMFLKRHFGSGYQLDITMKSPAPNLVNEIEHWVPTATVTNKTEASLTIGLPATEVRRFPDLFRSLDSSHNEKIDYSLSCTNMDDVFLKVQQEEGVNMAIDDVDMPTMLKQTQDQRDKQSPASRVMQQAKGFLFKRFQWVFANWVSFVFFIILCPIIAMYLTMSGVNSTQETSSADNLTLSLNFYGENTKAIVLEKNSNDALASSIETYLRETGASYSEVINSDPATTALLDSANNDLLTYRTKMIVSFDTRETPNAFYSTLAYHSAPIAYGMLTASLLNQTNNAVEIITNSYPYEFGQSSCAATSALSVQVIMMWLIFGVALTVTTAYFIILPHTERVTNIKHLQLMTGAQPILYWLTNFVADITLYMVPLILSLVVLLIFDTYNLFSYCIVVGGLALVMLLFGISNILCSYFCSYFFKTYTSAMEIMMFVSYIAAITSWVGSLFAVTEWFPYLFNLIPWVPTIRSMIKIVNWAINVSVCEACNVGVMAETCKTIRDDATLSSFDMQTELIYLVIDGIIYLVLLLAIDHGLFRMLEAKAKKAVYGPIEGCSELSGFTDVSYEKELVTKNKVTKTVRSLDGTDHKISAQRPGDVPPIFVCDGFGKKFSRNLTAVYDVTFAIQRGECFGLLGVNGAGKSTTFGMLTGTSVPTKGDSRIMNYSLTDHRTKYLKRLGYCPQLDGLLLDLSARSQLKLFGRLRGIPSSELHSISQKWIDALDMSDICDRPCKGYSGGNKRKLSTAIALIADPPVVLLDEPSTGVDPVIRRKIWSILKYCRQTNGQTIIITSHSMDECEAVCDRLTVMVKGRMKCIGTVPSLKNVYGQGYILLVKLLFTCTENEALQIKSEIERKFSPNIQLQDKQHGLFSFHITSKTVPLHFVFETMIAFKSTYPAVEDFSVSDISLEQVFLSLAKLSP